MGYKEVMTTEEIVNLVQGYGDDTDGAKAEMKRLVKEGALKIDQIATALRSGSKDFPGGWPANVDRVNPSPFVRFINELWRENGFPNELCM